LSYLSFKTRDRASSPIASLHRHLSVEKPSLIERYGHANQIPICDRLRVCRLPMEPQGLIRDRGDALELNLRGGKILPRQCMIKGMLREVKQIRDRREGVIDFVRDGTRETANGIELFRLQQNLLRTPVFGHVDSEC